MELDARVTLSGGLRSPAEARRFVARTLTPLLGESTRLAGMGAAAARFGRRYADERLVDLVLEAATRRGGDWP